MMWRRNVRIYIHEISPMRLLKHALNEDDNHRLVNTEGEKPEIPQPFSKSLEQKREQEG